MSGAAGPLKLCVNGNLGSGKSTVAKKLAQKLGLDYFATGGIQRALAEKLGITILELNQRAETDKSIDTLLDAQFEPIAAAHERIVFDSRLAWNFVPNAVKVRLLCHPATSAARIFADRDSSRGVEAFESVDAAQASIAQRRASERKRFQDLYRIDIEDLGNYDLVLQTDLVAPDHVVAAMSEWLAGPRASGALMLNPRMVFPLKQEVGSDGARLKVVQVGDGFYAATGAEPLAAAAKTGRSWIEAERLETAALDGVSAERYVRAHFDAATLEAWEAEQGFSFSVPADL